MAGNPKGLWGLSKEDLYSGCGRPKVARWVLFFSEVEGCKQHRLVQHSKVIELPIHPIVG